MTQQRCPRGQQLWNDAHRSGMSNDARIVAWIAYQDHWATCRECNAHRAAEWAAAERLPAVPHEEGR